LSAYAPGSQVFAVRNVDETRVYAYGAGVYVGDFPRPGWLADDASRRMAAESIRQHDADPLDLAPHYESLVAKRQITRAEADEALRRADEHHEADLARPTDERINDLLRSLSLNPKIVLDDGAGVVWGCECWWAPEDHPRWEQYRQTHQFVTVPAPHRAELSARRDS
jgi:hypothetical protein